MQAAFGFVLAVARARRRMVLQWSHSMRRERRRIEARG
jgi:hypothetical protein